MNAEFCMSCGARYEYALRKPNFCSACGNVLNELSEAAQSPSTSAVVEEVVEAQETESVPGISRLEYDINQNGRALTFGDLVSQATHDPNEVYTKMEGRPKPKSVRGEDIQKQILNECRSARQAEEVGE